MTQNYRLLITIMVILFGQDVINYNFFVYFFIFLIAFISLYLLLEWYFMCNFADIDNMEQLENFNFFKSMTEKTKTNALKIQEDSDDDEDISISLSDLKYIEPSISNNKNNNDDLLKPPNNETNIISIKNMINKEFITNINDLISIANYYEKNILNIKEENDKENIQNLYLYNKKYYTINLELVYKIRGPLIKLKKMVGLAEIKNEIIDLILYYLMNSNNKNNNMLHMTLEGSPGCGKTKLAKIISQILNGMNILKSDKIVYAKSTDLIGQYVGQTGPKTQKVIDKAMGGILFIDEAYGLGDSNGISHNFSSECINVLNQNLSDNKNKFICIIAGYSEELEDMFFSINPGLKRRFPFRFKIKPYTYSELLKIFIQKIYKLKWKLYKDVDLDTFFKNNIKYFKYFGGDIDTLIQNIKYSHSRRIICEYPDKQGIITNADIEMAFDKFKNSRKDNIKGKSSNKKKDFFKNLLSMTKKSFI
jgi:SpoVK/Ycf46/Vps4 family AAA+-type ATPase